MRKKILILVVPITLSMFACLSAPNEPAAPTSAALNCGAGEQPFNGACRETCTSNADCSGNLVCMDVGSGVDLCLDYQHCAHLDNDSVCDAVYGGSTSYPYEEPPPPYPYYPFAGCVGDAHWLTAAATGSPSCGQQHTVNRCRHTPSGCALVQETTLDIADP
jgi:hypothetical protein